MPGKLDEISRVIGQQEANLAGLNRTFDQHCADDDRRHQENIDALRSINGHVAKLNETLAPLVKSVAFMRPIVEGYQVSRWKAAGALSLASAILVGLGWVVTSIAGEFVKWIVAHIR